MSAFVRLADGKTEVATDRRNRQRLPALPWHATLLLGEAAFVCCKWILPTLCASSRTLQPIAAYCSGFAVPFSALVLLSGIGVLAARKRRRSPDKDHEFQQGSETNETENCLRDRWHGRHRQLDLPATGG
ncbi:MAG: hypothetical protein WAZ34_13730 [Rhodocyclaceae bacterium]